MRAPGPRSSRPSASEVLRGVVSDPRLGAILGALGGSGSRHARRFMSAALAALAVVIIMLGLRGPAPTSTTMVVAGRDIAAGSVITSDDLTTAPWQAARAPVGLVTQPDQAVGSRTAVPLVKGAPVGTNALVGPSLLDDPGLVLAPVRVNDPAAADLVTAGDRVDVLAASTSTSSNPETSAAVVALDARVVATGSRTQGGSSSSYLGVSNSDGGTGIVLLALDRATATRVAAAAASSRLSIVVRAR